MVQEFKIRISGIGFSNDPLTFTADEIRDILHESDRMDYSIIEVEEE